MIAMNVTTTPVRPSSFLSRDSIGVNWRSEIDNRIWDIFSRVERLSRWM